MAELPDKDEILYVDLKGRDPDDGFTQVPYVKGMLFLRRLEEIFGRAALRYLPSRLLQPVRIQEHCYRRFR